MHKKLNNYLKLLATTLFVLVFILPLPIQANIIDDNYIQTYELSQRVTGSSQVNEFADNIIANIIEAVLGFLGLLFVVLIIWSGYQWMTAGGNSEAITAAKKRMLNAVIGLIIVLSAYIIADFVISRSAEVTTGTKLPN